jgi:hypothetical protein
VVKSLEAFLPWQVGFSQQPLAACDLAVIDLLLAEGIEELAGASALCFSLVAERLPVVAKAAKLELFE